jgi:hypothetical protein
MAGPPMPRIPERPSVAPSLIAVRICNPAWPRIRPSISWSVCWEQMIWSRCSIGLRSHRDRRRSLDRSGQYLEWRRRHDLQKSKGLINLSASTESEYRHREKGERDVALFGRTLAVIAMVFVSQIWKLAC